ncbi:flagellar biosynthetic protein FliR [Solimonas sp. K1W22B-7]|uniref:flagellar biosynthetic protein FliR n=1 Tax=Solimonas sp. K1W22B-7 TaxID=2303331 RepID=UPI000E334AAB|nr:flagellar biosynthetic protein FliR [Solimonas sp. K1W22B-7]AXQ28200.1 flagellar biosynthetic protein FliR [Solimonas sp. K1W22B-7]
MEITQAQLDSWLLQFFLPFARIAGLLMVAPVFGTRGVPAMMRLLLALMICLLIAPLLPAPAPLKPFGATWFLAVAQQVGLGVAMGFVLQLVFEGIMMGGELISYSMGLSFAQMADPIRGSSSPVVGKFLLTLAMLMFLAMNGHLVALEMLAESFHTMPPGPTGLDAERCRALALLGSQIFSGGLRLALPVMVALLTVNLAFGIMSRAAPSLNLMSVGFPASLIAGLLLLYFGLEGLGPVLRALLENAWAFTGALMGADRV